METVDPDVVSERLRAHLSALGGEPGQPLEAIASIAAANSKTGRELRRMLWIPIEELPPRGNLALEEAIVEAERCIRCLEPVCSAGPVTALQVKKILCRLARGDVEEAYQLLLAAPTLCPQDDTGGCVLEELLGPGCGVAVLEVLKTLSMLTSMANP